MPYIPPIPLKNISTTVRSAADPNRRNGHGRQNMRRKPTTGPWTRYTCSVSAPQRVHGKRISGTNASIKMHSAALTTLHTSRRTAPESRCAYGSAWYKNSTGISSASSTVITTAKTPAATPCTLYFLKSISGESTRPTAKNGRNAAVLESESVLSIQGIQPARRLMHKETVKSSTPPCLPNENQIKPTQHQTHMLNRYHRYHQGVSRSTFPLVNTTAIPCRITYSGVNRFICRIQSFALLINRPDKKANIGMCTRYIHRYCHAMQESVPTSRSIQCPYTTISSINDFMLHQYALRIRIIAITSHVHWSF